MDMFWTAEQAVESYCDEKLGSLEVDEDADGAFCPLVIFNDSPDDDLIMACVTDEGDVEEGATTIPAQTKYVEHTYFGYTYVFGRRRRGGDDMKEINAFSDLVVLGAYRPTRSSSEPEFPCRVLKWNCGPPRPIQTKEFHWEEENETSNYEYDPSWTCQRLSRCASDTDTGLELGSLWNAQQAAEAWRKGTLVSDDDEEGESDSDELKEDGETKQEEEKKEDKKEIYDDSDDESEDQDEIIRLWLLNHSQETVVYGTLTANGKLRRVGVLPPLKSSKQHLIPSYQGDVIVFGKPRFPEVLVQNLDDLIVVGAYQPERYSAYWEEGDEHDFPCHKLHIHPPLITSTDQKQQHLRGTPANLEKNDISYDTSWTVTVEEVMKMEELNMVDTTTKHYDFKHLTCGSYSWPVYFEPACFATPEKRNGFIEDIEYALRHLPDHARNKLLKNNCAIWVNKAFSYGPSALPYKCQHLCYHGGKVNHFREYKLDERKHQCVEVYDFDDYFDYNRPMWGVGGVWIHELAHAYHGLCCSEKENKLIETCYNHAMKQGLYESVEVHTLNDDETGRRTPNVRDKGYVCKNAQEYFAELSTAFLGSPSSSTEEYNKWYPFNRAQLKQHDPEAYDMLCKVWKVKKEPTE